MIIQNVRVIDPANDFDKITCIHINDGKIAGYYETTEALALEDDVIDGSGLIAAPGLVDVHVHFRDPGFTYKEDIHTGAMASIAGGYTSVVMMANTNPTIDSQEVLKDVLTRGSREPLHIYSCVNATKGMNGKEIVDYELLKSLGAVGVTDDGKPILDADLFSKVCKDVARLNLPLSLHEEDPKYIKENGVNSGEAAKALGLTGSDRMAEISMIERDINIAKDTGVNLCIQHISTKEGVELVRKAKSEGMSIHAEATPHHFSLTDEAVAIHKTLAKMNPPLRKKEDMLAIRQGLKDGTIDMIATDHAPHSEEEKSQEFAKAPSGIIGLETALSLAITNLINEDVIDYSQLIRLMSFNPATLYGLKAGSIGIGDEADIVIFDPNADNHIDKFYSKSKNSPFIGEVLKGKVKYTIVSGQIVFDSEKE